LRHWRTAASPHLDPADLRADPPLHLSASHRAAQCGDPGRSCPVAVLALHRVHASQPGLCPVPAGHLRSVPVRRLTRHGCQLRGLRLPGRPASGAVGRGPRCHLRAVPAAAAAARPDAVRGAADPHPH
ncbi:unnamed protein product, partial [Gulo gulo]